MIEASKRYGRVSPQSAVRIAFAWWLLVLLLVSSSRVLAQAAPAEALFEEGRKALAAGDLGTACARFRASDKLDPAPGTKANLAECEEKRGNVATAWEVNRTALGQLPASDPRSVILKQRIAALEPRLPKLVLELAADAPRDTTVREGDATLGSAGTYGVALPLDPGKHHLIIAAHGCTPRPVDVVLVEGKTTESVIEPGPVATADATAPSQESREARTTRSGGSPGPWIVGGIGIAALVVGTVTGAVVLQKKSVTNSHCSEGPPPTCRDQAGLDAASSVRSLGPVTTVALAAGAAGIAVGGVWLGLSRSDSPRVKVGVVSARGGAAWTMEASW